MKHVTHSGPEVLFKTCVAMKFIDDDDDDEHCNLVQSNSFAILTFSDDRAISLVDGNFRATLATFVSSEAAWFTNFNCCEL